MSAVSAKSNLSGIHMPKEKSKIDDLEKEIDRWQEEVDFHRDEICHYKDLIASNLRKVREIKEKIASGAPSPHPGGLTWMKR